MYELSAKNDRLTLYQENAEIHGGLLEAGHEGKTADFPDNAVVPAERSGTQVGTFEGYIQKQSDARHILGNHGGNGGACDAEGQYHNEQQIQADVQKGGNSEKPERCHGVADGTQQAGEKVIQKGRHKTRKNNQKIFPHGGIQFRGYL